jgi:hypothetical protein
MEEASPEVRRSRGGVAHHPRLPQNNSNAEVSVPRSCHQLVLLVLLLCIP